MSVVGLLSISSGRRPTGRQTPVPHLHPYADTHYIRVDQLTSKRLSTNWRAPLHSVYRLQCTEAFSLGAPILTPRSKPGPRTHTRCGCTEAPK